MKFNGLKKLALSSILSFSLFQALPAFSQDNQSINTLVELNSAINYMELKINDFIELQKSLNPEFKVNINASDIFKSLNTYIDLNVIGAGKNTILLPDKIINFVTYNIEKGKDSSEISLMVIEEFKKGSFSTTDKKDEDDFSRLKNNLLRTQFGAFLVPEFEYHQEDDGKFEPLMEINQARIFFSSNINIPKSPIYFLAEWNPLPEEVIHHIESLDFQNNGKKYVLQSTRPKLETGELVPFEQLYVNLSNLFDSGINLTLGQFRIPFGFWSDYTSHRNFSTTKNNMLVNGFALKKLDLGFMLDKKFNNLPFDSTLSLKASVVNGRLTRTFPLARADNDTDKDFVGSVELINEKISLGASAYLGALNVNKKVAYGAHFLIPTKYVSISGEYVYQHNNDINSTFKAFIEEDGILKETNEKFGFNTASSHSAYVQFDYHIQDTFKFMKSPTINFLTNDLHLYGLYDFWTYFTDGKMYKVPAYKVFHGLRYQLNKNARWTIIEYGRMFTEDYNKGQHHLSTQFEITF